MPDMTKKTSPAPAEWKDAVAEHRTPVLRSSVWQLVNSVVPYLALWALMIWTFHISYWITLGLAVVAAGFLVRIFIIFHDCGHGSFFKSRRANHIVEYFTGLLTLTPYRQWRHEHALHHATAGDLDHRGTGDVWTMTVREYLDASRWRRLRYRLVRNPLVLLFLGPLYVFVIEQRFPSRGVGKRVRSGVHWTNAGLLAIAVAMSLTFGIKTYVLIQLPVILIGGAAGIWLFYVQHQFEDMQWTQNKDWNYTEAALLGSSYYRLPKFLQWFSGNIGFHHIHHLSPAIPNYNLERCHKANPMFQNVPELTLLSSLKSMTLHLWDEQREKLVSFGRARAIRRESAGKG